MLSSMGKEKVRLVYLTPELRTMKKTLLYLTLFITFSLQAQISAVDWTEEPQEDVIGQSMDITTGDVLKLIQIPLPDQPDQWAFQYQNSRAVTTIKRIDFLAEPGEIDALYSAMKKKMAKSRDLKPTNTKVGERLIRFKLSEHVMTLYKANTRKWEIIFRSPDNLSFAFALYEEQLDEIFGIVQ